MRLFPVFGHDDHDVSVLCVFLVDMCVTEFNITIHHLTITSHFLPEILDIISRKSNRLRLKIVTKVNGKDVHGGYIFNWCSVQIPLLPS